MGIPDNYNPTTNLNYSLDVNAGDRADVGFGIQSKDIVVDPGATTQTNQRHRPYLVSLEACFCWAELGWDIMRGGQASLKANYQAEAVC